MEISSCVNAATALLQKLYLPQQHKTQPQTFQNMWLLSYCLLATQNVTFQNYVLYLHLSKMCYILTVFSAVLECLRIYMKPGINCNLTQYLQIKLFLEIKDFKVLAKKVSNTCVYFPVVANKLEPDLPKNNCLLHLLSVLIPGCKSRSNFGRLYTLVFSKGLDWRRWS
jgi:hypothetical protein